MPIRTTPIPWGEYSEGQIETLLAALLLRLHAGARRMDGSGGDDGVDVLKPVEGGSHVFEIKSFTERLTTKQKSKIAKSLKTAVAKRTDMVAWTLVLPLEHSPAEERWMREELSKLTSVPLDWVGRARIEEELFQHPDLVRTFAPGSVEHRALDYLTEHHLEQARPPDDMPEGLRRAQRLRGQLGQIDPYYDFDVVLGADSVTTVIRPKGEHTPPIQFHMRLQAEQGSPEAADIESFMLYGRPVKLGPENIVSFAADIPGGLGELFADMKPLQALMGPDLTDQEQVRARLDAVDSAGRVLRSLSVSWSERSQGPLGGSHLSGRDRSGFLEVTLTKGAGPEGQIAVRTDCDQELLPGDVLPAMRFLRDLRRASAMHIIGSGLTVRLALPGTGQVEIDEQDAAIWMAEALERIQEATGSVFPIPASWKAIEALNVAFYDELLRSGHASFPFPDSWSMLPLHTVRELLGKGVLPRVQVNGKQRELPVELFGHKIVLPSRFHYEAAGVLVREPLALARLCASNPPPSLLQVRLTADELTDCRFYLDGGESDRTAL